MSVSKFTARDGFAVDDGTAIETIISFASADAATAPIYRDRANGITVFNAAADKVRLKSQPTGANPLAVATVDYVNGYAVPNPLTFIEITKPAPVVDYGMLWAETDDNFVHLANGAGREFKIGVERWTTVPSAWNSTGLRGQVAYATGFKYECVATNIWIRYAVTWNF